MGTVRGKTIVMALAGLIVMDVAMPGIAHADAIDGHWCHQDGRRLQITGPVIVTPAKTRADGQYDRHYFSYVVPAGDPGAGTTVNMALMGEMTMIMKAGNTADETWNRCGPPISLGRGLGYG